MTVFILCAWFHAGFGCIPFRTEPDCLAMQEVLAPVSVETSCRDIWVRPKDWPEWSSPIPIPRD